LPDSVTETCQINLNDEVELPAQEGGVIKEILVKEGQNVKVGEKLVQIDDDIPQQQLNVAKAELIAAEEKASNPIPKLYSEASLAVANAEYKVSEEANRKVKDSVPFVVLNKLYLQCKEASLSIEKAVMDTRIAEKERDVKKAQLAAAKASLEHRQLRSTLDGQVQKIKSHVGEWLQTGQTVLCIVQMDVLRAEVFLKPSEYAPAEVIQRPVTISADLARGRSVTFPGQIVFVDPKIRPDGKYLVRAEVTNRKENDQWLLRPGMKAQMTIKLK
jgi:multidrug efflux pump subunit AcrA (membrane-fusion protein)